MYAVLFYKTEKRFFDTLEKAKNYVETTINKEVSFYKGKDKDALEKFLNGVYSIVKRNI